MFGMGITAFIIGALILIASYFTKVSYLFGVFLIFIISILLLNRFTEGKAQRSKNREFVKSGILDGDNNK